MLRKDGIPHLLSGRILELFENETRCSDVYDRTWHAHFRPTDPRRRLRQRGLPSGMRRPKWCCGRAQGTRQTALSFLRQMAWMRRAEWGRSRAQAIIAEFPVLNHS